jgi:hypothetical protein
MWSQYNGTQPNDPAKLGDALVKIAAMQNPPKVFAAGSDALSTITLAIEDRLRDMRAHENLSTEWRAVRRRAHCCNSCKKAVARSKNANVHSDELMHRRSNNGFKE